MSALSDSSLHDDEPDIIEEYENQESDDNQGNASEGRNDEDDEAEESKGRRIDPATSKRHIIRNPQPKLNTERLKGPKGIHTIEKYFEGFKFHGKGHEKTDLDRVMKRVEHWAHRLFPKLDYDDFLARLEVLGTKKDLQAFVKKYRMDMVSADDDMISKDIIEDEEAEEDSAPIDEFDMLIAEQIEKQKQATVQQRSLNNSASEDAFNQLLLPNSLSQNSQPVRNDNPPSQLSDEIKARIERNRQQALERKMARLKQREEEVKRKKLEEAGNIEASQDTVINDTIKESELNAMETEADTSTANERENSVNKNADTVMND